MTNEANFTNSANGQPYVGRNLNIAKENILAQDISIAAVEVSVTALETRDYVTALIPGTTVDVDMSDFNNFSLEPVQNFTLSNPTEETVGQRGVITITQDATGSRVVTLGSEYKTIGGAGITLTTTASAVDLLRYEVISDTLTLVELVADIK